ncbi:hypothetical protein DPMN_156626 [Dreissena polymorpha]|uniref:Uncharacterized protein n=1 Tax=Dreissena polymorpha TaxID=45954 RepID=A0A9D4FQ42_DREPO|nr:hypothetical protein DPMN_156626 [Dreissena polymorpha]
MQISNRYLIVVGGTRSGSDFQVSVVSSSPSVCCGSPPSVACSSPPSRLWFGAISWLWTGAVAAGIPESELGR